MAELSFDVRASYQSVLDAQSKVKQLESVVNNLQNKRVNINSENIRKDIDTILKSMERLQGNLQRGMNGVTSSIKNVSNDLHNAGISAETFAGKTNSVHSALQGLNGGFSSFGENIKHIVTNFVMYGMVFETFQNTIGSLTSSLEKIKGYTASNSTLGAILGLDTSQLDSFIESSERLGRSTMFTASQVTQLQTELSKLGFQANDIHAMEQSVLNFAQSAGASLPDAAGLAGAAMRMFGLSMEEAGRVTGAMSASIMSSALDFQAVRDNLAQFGPVAKQVGLSVEEALTAFGVLKNQGYDGSMAATSLRNILNEMAGGKISKKLGYQVDSFEKFKQALIDLGEGGMQGAKGVKEAMDAVGKRGGAQLLALVQEMKNGKLEDVEQRIKSGANEETTQGMANRMVNNLSGSIKMMESAWEGFILSFRNIDPIMKEVVDSITDGIRDVQEFIAPAGDISRERLEEIIDLVQTLVAVFATFEGGKYMYAFAQANEKAAVETIAANERIIASNMARLTSEQELLYMELSVANGKVTALEEVMASQEAELAIYDSLMEEAQKEMEAAITNGDIVAANAAETDINTLAKERNALQEEVLVTKRELGTAAVQRNTLASKANTLASQLSYETKKKELWVEKVNAIEKLKATLASNKLTLANMKERMSIALNTIVTKGATAAQIALNTAIEMCPYFLLAAAIGAACYGLYKWITYTDEATQAQEEMNKALEETQKEATKEVNRSINEQVGLYASLRAAQGTTAEQTNEYREGVEKLAKAMQEQGIKIDENKDKMEQVNAHFNEYLQNLRKELEFKARAESIAAVYQAMQSEIDKYYETLKTHLQDVLGSNEGQAIYMGLRWQWDNTQWEEEINQGIDEAWKHYKERVEAMFANLDIDESVKKDAINEIHENFVKEFAARKNGNEIVSGTVDANFVADNLHINGEKPNKWKQEQSRLMNKTLTQLDAEIIKFLEQRKASAGAYHLNYKFKVNVSEEDFENIPKEIQDRIEKIGTTVKNAKTGEWETRYGLDEDGNFWGEKQKEHVVDKAKSIVSSYYHTLEELKKKGVAWLNGVKYTKDDFNELAETLNQYRAELLKVQNINVRQNYHVDVDKMSFTELAEAYSQSKQSVKEYEAAKAQEEQAVKEAQKAQEEYEKAQGKATKSTENATKAQDENTKAKEDNTEALDYSRKATDEATKSNEETAKSAEAAAKASTVQGDKAKTAGDKSETANKKIEESSKKGAKGVKELGKETDKVAKDIDKMDKEHKIKMSIDEDSISGFVKMLKWLGDEWDKFIAHLRGEKTEEEQRRENANNSNQNNKGKSTTYQGAKPKTHDWGQNKKQDNTPKEGVDLLSRDNAPQKPDPKAVADAKKKAEEAKKEAEKAKKNTKDAKKKADASTSDAKKEAEKMLDYSKKYDSLDNEKKHEIDEWLKANKNSKDFTEIWNAINSNVKAAKKRANGTTGTNPAETARKEQEKFKKTQEDIKREREKMAKDMETAMQQARIGAMKESSDRIVDQYDLNKKKEIEKIKKDAEERERKWIEQERKLFESNPENKAAKGGVGKSFDENSIKTRRDYKDFAIKNEKLMVQELLALDNKSYEDSYKNYESYGQKRVAEEEKINADIEVMRKKMADNSKTIGNIFEGNIEELPEVLQKLTPEQLQDYAYGLKGQNEDLLNGIAEAQRKLQDLDNELLTSAGLGELIAQEEKLRDIDAQIAHYNDLIVSEAMKGGEADQEKIARWSHLLELAKDFREAQLIPENLKGFEQQYEEKKKFYDNQIKELENRRDKAESESERKIYDEAIIKAKKNKATELNKISFDELKADPSYVRAFQNMKGVTTETLQYLVKRFEDVKKSAAENLDPNDLQAYIDTIQKLREELISRGASTGEEDGIFKRLHDANVAYKTAKTEYNQAVKTYGKDSNQAKVKREAMDVAKGNQKVLSNEVIGKLGEIFDGVTKALDGIASKLDGVAQTLVSGTSSIIGSVKSGISGIEEGGIGGWVDAALSFVNIISTGVDMIEALPTAYSKIADQQHKINQLTKAVNGYKDAVREARQENESWFAASGLSKLEQDFEDNGDYLKQYTDKLNEVQAKYQDASSGFAKAAPAIIGGIAGAVAGVFTFGVGVPIAEAVTAGLVGAALGTGAGVGVKAGLNGLFDSANYARAKDNLRVQTQHKTFFRGEKTQDLQSWINENLGNYKLFGEDGFIDTNVAKMVLESGATLVGDTKETLEDLVELKEKYDEFLDSLREYVSQQFSPLVENMGDAIWDAFENGKGALDSFRDYASATFKNIAKDIIKTILVKDVFGDYQEKMVKATEKRVNGQMSDDEYWKYIADETDQVMEKYEKQAPVLQELLERMDGVLEGGTGIDIREGSAETKGTINSAMSIREDTANELVGRVTAVQLAVENLRLIETTFQSNLLVALGVISDKLSDSEFWGNLYYDEIVGLIDAVESLANKAEKETIVDVDVETPKIEIPEDSEDEEASERMRARAREDMQAEGNVPADDVLDVKHVMDSLVNSGEETEGEDSIGSNDMSATELLQANLNAMLDFKALMNTSLAEFAIKQDAQMTVLMEVQDILAQSHLEIVGIHEDTSAMLAPIKNMANDIYELKERMRNL